MFPSVRVSCEYLPHRASNAVFSTASDPWAETPLAKFGTVKHGFPLYFSYQTAPLGHKESLHGSGMPVGSFAQEVFARGIPSQTGYSLVHREERKSHPLKGAEAAEPYQITHCHGQKWCRHHGDPTETGSSGG